MAAQAESMHPDLYKYPIEDAMRAEVEKRYLPFGDQKEGQLTLSPGDIVWVLRESADGWCGGHKEGDENTGWFPASIIRKLPRGDCEEEEERKSSALYTDHRPIASPQALNRKVSAAQTELAETKQRLETAEKDRGRLDEQVKVLSKKNLDLEHEKQRLTKKCDEMQTKVKSLQDDCRRTEEQLRSQKEQFRLAEEALRNERNRIQSLEGKLKQLEEHRLNLEAAMQRPENREDASMSKSTSGISRTDGHRTPSMPHTVSGSLQAPPAPCAAIASATSIMAIGQVSSSPLSARQAAGISSRHASPRHGPGARMPPLASSSIGSPQLRQRVPSQRDLTDASHVSVQGVHALRAKFERSTSNAPARETSSNVIYSTASTSSFSGTSYTLRQAASTMPVLSSSHVTVASSAARAGSREAPIQVRRVMTPNGSRTGFQEEPETPNARLTHEDVSRNLDLSPLKRSCQPQAPQACTLTRGAVTGYSHPAYSPTPTRTIVQDQIKKLEATRR